MVTRDCYQTDPDPHGQIRHCKCCDLTKPITDFYACHLKKNVKKCKTCHRKRVRASQTKLYGDGAYRLLRSVRQQLLYKKVGHLKRKWNLRIVRAILAGAEACPADAKASFAQRDKNKPYTP